MPSKCLKSRWWLVVFILKIDRVTNNNTIAPLQLLDKSFHDLHAWFVVKILSFCDAFSNLISSGNLLLLIALQYMFQLVHITWKKIRHVCGTTKNIISDIQDLMDKYTFKLSNFFVTFWLDTMFKNFFFVAYGLKQSLDFVWLRIISSRVKVKF